MPATMDETSVEMHTKTVPTCIMCKIPLCETCGQCETDDCRLVGKSATTKADLINLKYLLAETQKARGYVAIAPVVNVPSPYRIISDLDDVASAVAAFKDGQEIFARPCPVRPRHGFVESRSVTGTVIDKCKQIERIFAEARAADDKAELMLIPTIKASHNIVLTPSRLAIGAGHDGATAGKKTVVIPLAGVPFKEITADILKQASVDVDKEDPYMEAVLVNGAPFSNDSNNMNTNVYLTQLRAGAKLPASCGADFIPSKVVVQEVMEAAGDLLEWERQVKLIKEGTVVYLVGGSLISHYGVHCIYNGIPIITSRVPKVGETIYPTDRIMAPNYEAISRGLIAGAMYPMTSRVQNVKQGMVVAGSAITAMIVALHNAAAMGGDEGFYLGAAASIMIRTGMAAAHGEARHKVNPGSLSRNQIYELAFKDFFKARSTMGHAWWIFKEMSWGGSYGGPKWASCTESVVLLDRAVRVMLEQRTQETVNAVVTALNHSVNQAHNNGWWLNKFVPQKAFDLGSKQSVYTLCIAAPVLADIKMFDVPEHDQLIEKWAKAGEMEYSNPSAKSTKAKINAGADYKETTVENVECDCPACSVPEEGQYNPPKPFTDSNVNQNVYGHVPILTGQKMVKAQGRLLKGQLHVQFRMDGTTGYYSFDAPSVKGWNYSGLTVDSWSGSNAQYFEMEVKQVGTSDIWVLYQGTDIKVAFNPVKFHLDIVPSDFTI